MRKTLLYSTVLALVLGCQQGKVPSKNPFLTDLNAPVDYANVSANDIKEYAHITLEEASAAIEAIRQSKKPTFNTVFAAMDDIINKMNIASNNCFMMYWVSPDSLSRVNGLDSYQLLDSLSTTIYSDKVIFNQMVRVKESDEYTQLKENRKRLVDDLILNFEQSGVNLEAAKREQYLTLTKEISQHTSEYSNNMNSAAEVLVLDEAGAKGLPENFKNTYRKGDQRYEIPVMNATKGPVMSNAQMEETRKAYYLKFNNRAADKNLDILEQLVKKRHALANIMGYDTYATYNLYPKMAKDPETVWSFINDLADRAKGKASADLKALSALKKKDASAIAGSPLKVWDIAYYTNQILKNKYQVDHEVLRAYLPIDQCLKGVLDIYSELFNLEFKKVANASVWHQEVDMYEVFEGEQLVGRFYLDLFPRPNKESWFYGVGLKAGQMTEAGLEIPTNMLLGNFTRPTENIPSLLSFKELNTLFHEFGHIIDGLSYKGEFSLQASSKTDFIESMSQIFENWTMNYEMLSSFAKHYETGEVLPKELFDNMVKAKNVSSGYYALSSLRNCFYDMNLYNKYNPEVALDSDGLWKKIDKELGVMDIYVEGTHPQASWIHINTHPVYYYGYLWSEVYAQDMYTEFEKNGLTDPATGKRFRELILSTGQQSDIIEAVETFLGRPSNNEAYIKSLGLN
ncbi:MAG: Zn-dependent oligopeptidase [Marinilabiliaceae bacterium]|nr:Zn-dependent oligopeptidase [Marinilabiliaceae bacterium]